MMTTLRSTVLHALAATALVLLALTGSAHAGPRTFAINGTGSSRVTFESDAPVENIVGVTTAVAGELRVDLGTAGKGASAKVTVDLNQVKTGIDKRDAHMRSKDFLDTAKFPTASFELAQIDLTGDPATPGGATGTARGALTIKGIRREVTVPVKVAFRKRDAVLEKLGFTGDVLRVTGRFDVQLSDHGIKVPAMLGQKVSNTVTITIALTGVAG